MRTEYEQRFNSVLITHHFYVNQGPQGLNLPEAVAPSVRSAGELRRSAANVLDYETIGRFEQGFAYVAVSRRARAALIVIPDSI